MKLLLTLIIAFSLVSCGKRNYSVHVAHLNDDGSKSSVGSYITTSRSYPIDSVFVHGSATVKVIE